jgi:hypothetical protein
MRNFADHVPPGDRFERQLDPNAFDAVNFHGRDNLPEDVFNQARFSAS